MIGRHDVNNALLHRLDIKLILATGLTGFVGRHLAPLLAAKYGGISVLAIVNISDSSEEEMRQRSALNRLGIQIIAKDLAMEGTFVEIPEGIRCIIHLASNTLTSSNDHSINENSIQLLLAGCEKSVIQPPLFVFASTIAVYDNVNSTVRPADEQTSIREPLTQYGRSKLASELLLRQSDKVRGVVIRVPGVFGNGVRPNGLFDLVDSLSQKGSLLSRLNYPGQIGIVHVISLAEFICAITDLHLNGDTSASKVTYLPITETLSYAELFRRQTLKSGRQYKVIKVPGFVWYFLRLVLKSLLKLELIIPHRVHNAIWQVFLVVSDSFYCVPKTTWGGISVEHRAFP